MLQDRVLVMLCNIRIYALLIIIWRDDNINCYRYYCLNKNVGDLCYCMQDVIPRVNYQNSVLYSSILPNIWDNCVHYIIYISHCNMIIVTIIIRYDLYTCINMQRSCVAWNIIIEAIYSLINFEDILYRCRYYEGYRDVATVQACLLMKSLTAI